MIEDKLHKEMSSHTWGVLLDNTTCIPEKTCVFRSMGTSDLIKL
jgi:hypothetical protein